MCGIFGIRSVVPGFKVEEAWLKQVTDTISHRGPDESGYFIDGGVGLGHQRLSIIDLSTGQQPMSSDAGTVTIVFNGEIYNYRELRTELISLGRKFKTSSDTEVILQSYLQYGMGCLQKLKGMFAFAIWDRSNRKLFLARDRVGIKPLYYIVQDKNIIFSSEIKTILASKLYIPSVNKKHINTFMTLGFVPDEETLFDGIKKLMPGYWLEIDNEFRINKQKYWDICNLASGAMDNEPRHENDFIATISESVKSHLVSDVPLGAFLSGGIDSSALVALMSGNIQEPVKTFSIGYTDNDDANELQYAEIVAKHFHTDHHTFKLKPLNFFSAIEKLLEFTEEPIDEPAGIAMYELAKLARQHVKVVLSGEGMDELLAGYPIYSKNRFLSPISSVYRLFGGKYISNLATRLPVREKVTKYIDWVSLPINQRYMSVNSRLSHTLRKRLFSDEMMYFESNLNEYFNKLYRECQNTDEVDLMQRIDIKTWLPECLLLRSDKMTMAASIELRVPFLDHDFVEFCTKLPLHEKISHGKQKFILRKAMKGILPDVIIDRPKKGFPVPISQWFRDELYDRVHEILTSTTARSRGYFNNDYIVSVLQQHKNNIEDHGIKLFYLLILELWHRRYID